MKKYASLIFVSALIVLIIAFSPLLKMNIHQPNYFSQSFEDALVLDVLEEDLQPDPVVAGRVLGTQKVRLQVLTGEYKGQVFETENPISTSHNVVAKKGMKLIAGMSLTEGKPTAWIYNYKSDNILFFMAAAFFVLLYIFGGKKGFKSIVSLVFTGIVIIFIMLPLIFQGYSPVPVAIFAAALVSIVSFILISGFEKKTYVAILGTICGVTAAGLISWIAGNLTHLSGVTMENSEQLLYVAQDYNIKIRGLMFTSILISSLGAVMDVSMSIASSTYEIFLANSKLNPKQLMKAAMNVGQDIMGTMADTLILAFAGGSFNLMMLIWGFQMNYRQYLNIPLIKTEIIQSLAGSIGIVLTVPATAFFAVTLFKQGSAIKAAVNTGIKSPVKVAGRRKVSK